jgi:hypothetical protein
MTEQQPNPSSRWPLDDHQQYVGGENNGVRINSMFSIESTDRLGATKKDKNKTNINNNDPQGDLMIMEGPAEESSERGKDPPTSRTTPTDYDNYGPVTPTNMIIQQHIDDDSSSEPIINLDSVSQSQSDVSDLNHAANNNNSNRHSNKTSWLNINSTSTSQGSQGSYAHQVPKLLGSYGSTKNNNKTDANHQPQHQKQQQHNKTTEKQTIERQQFIPTPQNSNLSLDDVLGPNGESMKSDLDDILGPQEGDDADADADVGKPSDLDDTLGPYEGSTVTGGEPSYDGVVPPARATTTTTTTASTSTAADQSKNNNIDYTSEYVHFRESEEKKEGSSSDNERKEISKKQSNNNRRPTPLQVNHSYPDSHHKRMDESLIPLPNAMVGYCNLAETPKGEGGDNISTTSSCRMTPSASRRAIDNIGEALLGRTDVDADSYAWSPREAAHILPEPSSDGMSTAFDTAFEESAMGEDQRSPSMASVTEKVTTAASISGHNHNTILRHQEPSSSKSKPSSTIVQQQQKQSQHTRLSELRINDSIESSSTWESKGTGITGMKSSMSASTNGDGGDTTTQGGDDETTLGVDTNESSMWEASTRADTFNTAESSCNTSYTGHTNSRRDTFSPRANSMLSPNVSSDTFSPSSRRTSRFSQTDSSQFSQTEDDTQFSPTEHTYRSDFSPTEQSQFSPTDHSGTQFTFASQSQLLSNTTSAEEEEEIAAKRLVERGSSSRNGGAAAAAAAASNDKFDDEDGDDGSKGGRMWQEAQVQASNSKNTPLSPRAKKFAESIMARTRSRADPDALLDNTSNVEGTMEKPTRSMVKISTQEEDGFIESTGIAKKRGRVVQLLTIALLSFLIAFLGGFWALSSCHFVSVAVQVDDVEFNLRFGLWIYSPIDSAFQGYSYCNQYDGDFVADAPWFGRISSLIALAGGGFSLGVLWLYLVAGRCVQQIWTSAVFAAAISGVLQLSTLSIFAGPICSQEVCTLGPAGIASIVAGCFYFVLAFEMHYQNPLVLKLDDSISGIPTREHPSQLMTNLEMTDFEYGAKAYVHRLTFGDTNPYPSLDEVQRENQYPVGETTMRGRTKNRKGSYVPPSAIV